VVGDVKATLAGLLPLVEQKLDGTHLAQTREHYVKARKALYNRAAPGKGLIHPQQVAKAINDQAEKDAFSPATLFSGVNRKTMS